MKQRNPLKSTKTVRLTYSQAHSLEATARSLGISESEFMRKVIMDAIERIQMN